MKTLKFVTALMLASMLYTGVQAQEQQAPSKPPKPPKDMEEKREMVQAMKSAFITRELDLSPEEAQKFWPVYNMYEKELQDMQKVHRDKMQDAKANMDKMSDKDVEALADGFLLQEQKELDLKKKYHTEFKKVLPIRKVGKLYHAEDKFKKELLEKMKDQKAPGQPKQPMKPNQPQMPDQPGE